MRPLILQQNVYLDFIMFLLYSDCTDFCFSLADALDQMSSFSDCAMLVCRLVTRGTDAT